MRFAKGHGTGNDFLILPDPDDALALPAELVARLCDRRFGLGADGVLRAVRTGQAGWFMDYRNADGSVAEMCGNGIRVFARYLLGLGLVAGPAFVVGTRAGPRPVWARPDGAITVDMGAPRVLGRGSATLGDRECRGLAVSLGNPHLACLVDEPVAEFDLSAPPVTDHALFPQSVNVEVVRACGARQLEMRVYERGSGATLSCGTGAVAAAVAAAAATAAGGQAGAVARYEELAPAGTWTVDVPGGRLAVALEATTSLLTGPAVIVAEGELSSAWLADPAAAVVSASS
jgi:diaminopimelate epimerase